MGLNFGTNAHVINATCKKNQNKNSSHFLGPIQFALEWCLEN